MDDIELAKRLTDRDPCAIEQLIDAHHAAIYRFLRQLTRRVEDAEDLTQQAMLRALNGAHRFDGRSSMRAWLYGIAFREFGRWRRRRLWLPLHPDRPAKGDAYASVVEAEALLDGLAGLSDACRSVFLLHHIEELSIAEIAASLSVPEGTVKSRLHTARHRLRALLGEEDSYVAEPCQP